MSLMDTGEATQETAVDELQNQETATVEQAPENPTDQPTENQWFLAEGIPGNGEPPEYFKKDKYGTLAEQAKAYKALEGRFGSFTGAPENYELNFSDEIKDQGLEFDKDDPLYESAVEFAKNSNMNQEGFDEMMNLYAMSKVAEGKAFEEAKAAELKALGDNAQARIDNLVNWGKTNLPEDLFQGFQEMAVSANAVRTMEKLISMSQSTAINPEKTEPRGGVTEEEVRQMQFEKDEYGNRRLQTDKEFRKRYEKLRDKVWGSQEHRNIIG